MGERTNRGTAGDAGLSSGELAHLQVRSDAKGLARLGGHVLAIAVALAAYSYCLRRLPPSSPSSILLQLLAAGALGFTFVTLFAAMHECVHRTAFKSQRLNDVVGWVAGLLSFYNSTFYRPYHGWHHRFTQLPGQDPELEDPKPSGLLDYWLQMSGIPWWVGKLRTHIGIAFGRTQRYRFLTEHTGPLVVRSVRFQLATYGAAIAVSVACGYPYFFVYWLLPVALAQPLLRVILLAEHGGCSESANPLTNTRTTHTFFAVRYLMWEMPFHAEHHRYPALPFFALSRAHVRLGPHLGFVARHGYLGVHLALLRSLSKQPEREHGI